ncbi:hypothetical protein PR048_017655 [Dryococelus australis]|uniref:Uncharacterized protein n=1 Tax=Dryococelus australis TaxID=614101 RepID=A0ABQ9HA68_9NEOP|nr:hypothetical protein PR048_017655 [Dryococelus australis]
MKERGKPEIPEKTHRPAASSLRITTCENSGVTRPGIQPACTPPTKANRAQSPAGSPDFRKWESCRKMPLVGGFSRCPPLPPTPSFRRRSILTSITLIGSQDLAAVFWLDFVRALKVRICESQPLLFAAAAAFHARDSVQGTQSHSRACLRARHHVQCIPLIQLGSPTFPTHYLKRSASIQSTLQNFYFNFFFPPSENWRHIPVHSSLPLLLRTNSLSHHHHPVLEPHVHWGSQGSPCVCNFNTYVQNKLHTIKANEAGTSYANTIEIFEDPTPPILLLRLPGAMVTERLACSPPTKAIRAQSPAGSLPPGIEGMWE